MTLVIEHEKIALVAAFVDEPTNLGMAFLRHNIISVEPENPITSGQFKRYITRRRPVVTPGKTPHSRTITFSQGHRTVDRTGIDYHDLIDQTLHAIQAVAQPLLLIAHDHTQRQPATAVFRLLRDKRCGDARRFFPFGNIEAGPGSTLAQHIERLRRLPSFRRYIACPEKSLFGLGESTEIVQRLASKKIKRIIYGLRIQRKIHLHTPRSSGVQIIQPRGKMPQLDMHIAQRHQGQLIFRRQLPSGLQRCYSFLVAFFLQQTTPREGRRKPPNQHQFNRLLISRENSREILGRRRSFTGDIVSMPDAETGLPVLRMLAQPFVHQAQIIGIFAFDPLGVNDSSMMHFYINTATVNARPPERGGDIFVHRQFKANIGAVGKHFQLAKTGLPTAFVD